MAKLVPLAIPFGEEPADPQHRNLDRYKVTRQEERDKILVFLRKVPGFRFAARKQIIDFLRTGSIPREAAPLLEQASPSGGSPMSTA